MDELELIDLLNKVPPETDKTDLPVILGPILRILAKGDQAQAEAYLTHRIKPRFGLNEKETTSYRQTINQCRKVLRSENSIQQEKQNNREYIAVFEGLVDIAVEDGNPVFLVKEDDDLVVKPNVELNGKTYYPPPIEKLPWLLPNASRVLKHFALRDFYTTQDLDASLYDELRNYFSGISDLPSPDYYDMVTTWAMHTYLMESFDYSPILCMFAVPERGKTRTGKAITYVSYRGVHVESLRESYIFRLAEHLNATIFIDVMDVWKKAQKMDSQDILLLRFERGSKVPRVMHPDKGPHRDTEYFSIFGPTIIGTNEGAHKILNTRCIPMGMPEANRTFDNNLTPEESLDLKEKLVAFRARHLGETLPAISKPAPGRLGDITAPLLQIIELVRPEHKGKFLNFINQLYEKKLVDGSDSFEGQIVKAVYEEEGSITHGLLAVKIITDRLNINLDRSEFNKFSYQRIGRSLDALGFSKGTLPSGASGIIWDPVMVERLQQKYGLLSTTAVTDLTDLLSEPSSRKFSGDL